MSTVRAYHAGSVDDIDLLLNCGSGLPEISTRNNWLGSGICFWASDPRRAEYWQAIHGKGAILESELETELLIGMFTNDQSSNSFLDLAKTSFRLLEALMTGLMNILAEMVKLSIALGPYSNLRATVASEWHSA